MKQFLFLPSFVLMFLCYGQPNEFLRRKSEELSAGMDVRVGEERIYCRQVIPSFYQGRDFELAWSQKDRQELVQILAEATAEGLNASDYHLSAIEDFKSVPETAIEEGEIDLLLTDAFLLYGSHFLNGKVNPESVDSEWKAIRREGNALEFLEKAIGSHQISEALVSLQPKHQGYPELKKAFKNYTEIQSQGGWSKIPAGETLKPGMQDSVRIPLLITRLMITGDLMQQPVDSYVYTDTIAAAVKSYQQRNGLEPDGNLGKMTTAALNVSLEERIDQIKINLERYRWISQELGSHYVVVNIADYSMVVYKDEQVTFKEKVIVGKPFRKTPVFSSRMTYMVVNPTWTVPPTILFNDILPEVKKNPDYLASKNIRVLQGQGSSLTVLDPHTIDWSSLSRSNFPYTLRQDPGPTNALGSIKFMFPNEYNVYIHDTPSKELFARADRAFSSGCIRLNKPMDFARYLLEDEPKWTEERFKSTLATGNEQSIILSKPVHVHILYLTAWSENGKVHFRNDLYQRDQPVLNALRALPPSI